MAELSTAQVRDVLIGHTINGVPEPIIYGGQIVGEWRRFNHRMMMWVLQHHMPDRYPGVSTTHRRGWGAAGGRFDAAARDERHDITDLEAKLDMITRNEIVRDIMPYPEKRAAYEVLNGPVDWGEYEDASA